jgi:hypothetical protein
MATRDEQISIAKEFGLVNVWPLWRAAKDNECPFYVACALMQKESGGKNVYGHDKGGVLSGYPDEVSEENFKVFRYLVLEQGFPSNGVGPAQLTYKGFFEHMEELDLKAWDPYDNMLYGLRLIMQYYDDFSNWANVGSMYNGSPEYGLDFARKVAEWKRRLA